MFSISFTKFHAGLLLGCVFMMMAVSFSLGYAAADWRSVRVVKEVRTASQSGIPVAPERKAIKATVPIFPAGGDSRPVKNDEKVEEGTNIRPSFYKALVEEENPKKGKMSPLQLKAASRQPVSAGPIREPVNEAMETPRVRPRSVERKNFKSRRRGPTKVSLPVRIEGTSGRFTIQVTVVQKPSRAIRITRNLQDAGFSAFLQRIELNGKGAWYRIRVGRFPDRQSAQRILKKLRLKALVHGGGIVPL
jgi:cell division septation protein DedD